MKKILLISAILLLPAFVAAQKNATEYKTQLVGVWQNSEGVGSGLTDNYQFFEDGSFKFNYNEMDGTKRILSYSGFWRVYKGRLHLHINRMELLLGGSWEKSSGSIATEYTITGGRVVEKEIKPIEKLSYSLSSLRFEDEMYTTVEIDGEKYWKLSSDPRTYEN